MRPQQESVDPWFTSGRLGDWQKLEQLHNSTGRPWDYQHVNGQTVLMMAARNGQLDFVSSLLSKKVNINTVDRYGYNALSYTMHGPAPVETKKAMCRLLVNSGADPFQEDQFKLSPILVMIENGFSDCIHLIKLSNVRPCDQVQRLTEVTSLVTYAEKEDETEIRDYFKSKGCL